MFDGETALPTPFEFDTASATTKGARDYQEDSFLCNFAIGRSFGFGIIADGIGGHAEGQKASALAAAEVFSHLKAQESVLELGKLNVPIFLQQAIKAANARIAKHVKDHADAEGMGTTLLVPVIRGDRLSWISVGDSPLYLWRGGALRQINKDHSMAPQIDIMVASGSLSKEQGAEHPDRSTLTSVINGDDIAQIDCPSSAIQLKDGDVIVAASDGLQSLSTAVIAQTIMQSVQKSSVDVAKALMQEVETLGNPDQDNTTFIVIKATAKPFVEEIMDLDAMPVLAQVEDQAAVPAPEAPAEAPKKERKVRWYRGQKYYD